MTSSLPIDGSVSPAHRDSGLRRVRPGPACGSPAFRRLYDEHVAFVMRNLTRLGVPDPALDDATQDVFIVVHRRLGDFEGRSTVRTWVFGIVLRVAREHRRKAQQRPQELVTEVEDERPGPHGTAVQREALERLVKILDQLEEARRATFILAHLEEMSVPEIAEAMGANVNTTSSRLRAARRDFNAAVRRFQAHDAWRDR